MRRRLNPEAVVFWLFSACIGWLFGGTYGAVVGFVIACGVSIFITATSNK